MPRARAPSVSIIMFTQSIITALKGGSCPPMALNKVTLSATMFTVSWNCRNRRILSNTDRPHFTAFTMLLKLSSRITMEEAALATAVPLKPIERPTSAARKAGPSLVPSPVTPTTSPPLDLVAAHSLLVAWQQQVLVTCQSSPGCSSSHFALTAGRARPLRRVTSSFLSVGEERARNPQARQNVIKFNGRKLSEFRSFHGYAPISQDPALLGDSLSGGDVVPGDHPDKDTATWHLDTASFTSGLSGSLMPKIPSRPTRSPRHARHPHQANLRYCIVCETQRSCEGPSLPSCQ